MSPRKKKADKERDAKRASGQEAAEERSALAGLKLEELGLSPPVAEVDPAQGDDVVHALDCDLGEDCTCGASHVVVRTLVIENAGYVGRLAEITRDERPCRVCGTVVDPTKPCPVDGHKELP